MTISNYEITPFVGVGELRLGMTQQQTMAILGEPDNRDDRQYGFVESYVSQGLIVHYDLETGTCEAIDMVRTARPIYRGRQLMGENWATIEPWFRSLDENVEPTDIGLESRRIGISISHAVNDDENDVVDEVFIFEKDYWDKEREYDFTPEGGWAETDEEFDAWLAATIARSVET
jgi:hypothetical protein